MASDSLDVFTGGFSGLASSFWRGMKGISIERAGFSKGFRLGNVGISANHSLALVNLGGGTASEILALKEKIEAAVQEKFDILLQHEPVFLGFD